MKFPRKSRLRTVLTSFAISFTTVGLFGCGKLCEPLIATNSASADNMPAPLESDPELPAAPIPRGMLKLVPLGGYEHGGIAAAEISAYEPASKRLFTVNARVKKVDILNLADPAAPTLIKSVSLGEYGIPNSVASSRGIIAVALAAEQKADRGSVVLLNSEGEIQSTVQVGYEPDMVTFSPDGNFLLVANEGEPVQDYSFDPPGSISMIDVTAGIAGITEADVTEIGFDKFDAKDRSFDDSVRIFGKNAKPSQDLEPEYIAVSADSKTAWVVCQENNAIAILDLESRTVKKLVGLGFKDHSRDGNWLDASDKDGKIRIRPWPVKGMYQPDGIATYLADGKQWLVTANEGDHRAFDGLKEKVRVADLKLNPASFPDAAQLQQDAHLGRLQVTNTLGDIDGDGQFEELYSFGGRSFSIWNSDAELVFDSGDQFERFIAERSPQYFNSDHEKADFEGRSTAKGVEPESVTIGEVSVRPYAFVVLERQGGIMVYDISHPAAPVFEAYEAAREFEKDPGDSGPEGVLFLSAKQSPTARPMLVVSNEVSGTTRYYDLIQNSPDDVASSTSVKK